MGAILARMSQQHNPLPNTATIDKQDEPQANWSLPNQDKLDDVVVQCATSTNDGASGELSGAACEVELETGQEEDVIDFDYPTVTHRHQITAEVADCPSCCGCSRLGKLYVCCPRNDLSDSDEDAPSKWFFGACWPCFIITLCLVAGIPLGVLIAFFGKVHIVIALLLLLVWKWNKQADSWHPPGSTYCVDSCVIVEGFDHFCPWTGTTVGGGNLKFFYGFTGGLGLLCIVVMIMVFVGLQNA